LLGIVLNCTQPRTEEEIEDLTPVGMVRSLTNMPVFGCLPYLENPQDLDKLAQVASNLDLEQLFQSRKLINSL
jgi:dethiobiotin synthetase